jgi:general secretion pathway protein K
MKITVGSGQSAVGSESSAKEKVPVNQCLTANHSALRHWTSNNRWTACDGVILIALLWILTALSVIALSFSKECFVEVAAARNAQSLETAYFAARAGIAAAIYRLMQKPLIAAVQPAGSQETLDPLDLGIVTGNLGGAEYRVDIQDESGKVNLNGIREQQLRLLVEACGIPKPDADIITDSILDWQSPPSAQPHPNGAKDDYYQTLIPSYKAKNGYFDTIEELLLVRGVTTDYFYGHPERAQDGSVVYRYGLSRCLTVYSAGRFQSQVNVNYAPLPVLLSTGMSSSAAQAIFDRRHVKPFKDIMELQREIPSLGTVPNLSTAATGIFTLTASARAGNSKARRVIRTVINLAQGQRTLYQPLYWNENIPDYEGNTP